MTFKLFHFQIFLPCAYLKKVTPETCCVYYIRYLHLYFQLCVVYRGLKNSIGQAQAHGFLNFFNPSPVSDLPSPNL